MVESDYPHADSSWPDTQRVLVENWGALPDDELRAVAGGNAARLFRHALPEADDWRSRRGPLRRGGGEGAVPATPPRRDRSSTRTATSSSRSARGRSCPTRSGPSSRRTRTATSTSRSAAPRSSPSRSAPWRGPGRSSTTRPRSGRSPTRCPAARIHGHASATWTPRASTRPCSTRRSGCTSLSSRTPSPPSGSRSPTTTGWRATARPIRHVSSAPPCCRCRTPLPPCTSCAGR